MFTLSSDDAANVDAATPQQLHKAQLRRCVAAPTANKIAHIFRWAND